MSVLHTVDVALGERSYPVLIGSGVISAAGTLIAARLPPPRAVIIPNPTVGALWLAPMRAA